MSDVSSCAGAAFMYFLAASHSTHTLYIFSTLRPQGIIGMNVRPTEPRGERKCKAAFCSSLISSQEYHFSLPGYLCLFVSTANLHLCLSVFVI